MRDLFPKFDWFWLVYTALLMWLWFPMWYQGHIPAFRDGFHFYLPQLVWLNGCYAQGEFFPVWNPNEGLGSSVAGQPSWQLFYPLRIIWFIPWVSLPQKLAVFYGVHQAIAALGILATTRHFNLSYWSRWFAALCYSLSCPIVFQHSNLIYLCSAAWIGWILWPLCQLLAPCPVAAGRNRSSRPTRNLATLTAACCLMFLCGDPHSAVNALIIIAVAALYVFIAKFWSPENDPGLTPNNQDCRAGEADHFSGNSESLAFRQTKAKSLQSSPSPAENQRNSTAEKDLLPTHRSTRSIGRCSYQLFQIFLLATIVWLSLAQFFAARSWYQTSSRAVTRTQVQDSINPWVNDILKEQPPEFSHVFDFSLSPWNLPTFLWPSIGGHYQPENSRWLDATSSEGRMWLPSLYLGLLPMLLCAGLIAGTCVRHPQCQGWLKVVIAFTLLAGMGGYSAGWLLRELLSSLGLIACWADTLPSDSQLSLYGLLTWVVPGYDRFRYPAKWLSWTIAGISIVAACRFDMFSKEIFSKNIFTRSTRAVVLLSAIGLLAVCVVALLPGNLQKIPHWLSNAQDRLLGPVSSLAVFTSIALSLVWPIAMLAIFAGCTKLPAALRPGALVILTAIELVICSRNFFLVTTEMPKISTTITPGRSESLFWANQRLARYSDFDGRLGKDQLSTQLMLSQTFVLGKLNHLQGKATLHSASSLQPNSVAMLKRWLEGKDHLIEQQPNLDAVLEYLGATHRLIKKSPSQFRWMALPGHRPFCELIMDSSCQLTKTDNFQAKVDWLWKSNQEIIITINAEHSGRLLIRQINDGKWQLEEYGRTQGISTEIEKNELFIVIPVQSGEHRIRVFRHHPLFFWK